MIGGQICRNCTQSRKKPSIQAEEDVKEEDLKFDLDQCGVERGGGDYDGRSYIRLPEVPDEFVGTDSEEDEEEEMYRELLEFMDVYWTGVALSSLSSTVLLSSKLTTFPLLSLISIWMRVTFWLIMTCIDGDGSPYIKSPAMKRFCIIPRI